MPGGGCRDKSSEIKCFFEALSNRAAAAANTPRQRGFGFADGQTGIIDGLFRSRAKTLF
jgi:hypothetical protein